MNDLRHEQEFILRVEQCAAALRKLELAIDGKDRQPQTVLAERFLQLSALAADRNLDAVRQITECVGERLSRTNQLPLQLQQLERNSLRLAAEWLDELMQLYTNNLPEPRGLINNLVESFVLLDRAETAGRSQSAEASDPFAADPVLTSEVQMSYARNIDPFSNDPGFGHLFDLFQRTLNHVACLGVTCGSDPFARDPEVSTTGSVDMFAKDPPLPLTDVDLDLK